MKAALVTIIYFLLSFSDVSWLNDMELTIKKAQTENKNILLYFSGSDWCKPCIQLKTYVLQSEEFKQYADEHYILIQADFPRLKKNRLSKEQVLHNEQLAEKFNPMGEFPLIVVLDKSGALKYKIHYNQETSKEFVERLERLEIQK